MTDVGRLSVPARRLLGRTAWLAPGHVPDDLVAALCPDEPDGPDGAVAELVRSGFVSPHPDGGFVTEAGAAESARTVLAERRQVEAVLTLGRYLGERGSPGEVARCLTLLPHLVHWAGLTRPEDDVVDGAMLLNQVIVLLLHQEISEPALPLAERYVRTCELHVGTDDVRTWGARSLLASVLDQRGQVRRAARLAEQVIAGVSAQYGEDHPQVWTTRQNLGAMYMRLREFDRAASLVRQLIDHHTAVSGPEDRSTLMARHNLAVVLQKAGRLDEAVAIWQECTPDFDRFLGPTDPDTLDVRHVFTEALEEQAGLDTGGMSLENAERMLAAAPGEPGRLTQRRLAGLIRRATVLRNQGRLDEAESEFGEAIARGGDEFGPGHPLVVSAHYRLALVHELRGHDDRALETAERGLRACVRSLGRKHQETLLTVVAVMSLLAKQKRTAELQQMIEEWLSDIIESWGFGHPAVRELARQRSALALYGTEWAR
ncbi:hypothetical protein GCM10010297_28570 [Streptomyces malachitofuscus]|nr:hypothetical protein GCM10010297_28570 [Streptomyces malachitofuscus]